MAYAYKMTWTWAISLSVVIFVLWPLLALPAGIFPEGYFTFWVILSMVSTSLSALQRKALVPILALQSIELLLITACCARTLLTTTMPQHSAHTLCCSWSEFLVGPCFTGLCVDADLGPGSRLCGHLPATVRGQRDCRGGLWLWKAC